MQPDDRRQCVVREDEVGRQHDDRGVGVEGVGDRFLVARIHEVVSSRRFEVAIERLDDHKIDRDLLTKYVHHRVGVQLLDVD